MNKQDFSALIFGDKTSKIAPWMDLFKDPVWVPKYNQSLQ
jgi:acyl-CoA oxidase